MPPQTLSLPSPPCARGRNKPSNHESTPQTTNHAASNPASIRKEVTPTLHAVTPRAASSGFGCCTYPQAAPAPSTASNNNNTSTHPASLPNLLMPGTYHRPEQIGGKTPQWLSTRKERMPGSRHASRWMRCPPSQPNVVHRRTTHPGSAGTSVPVTLCLKRPQRATNGTRGTQTPRRAAGCASTMHGDAT